MFAVLVNYELFIKRPVAVFCFRMGVHVFVEGPTHRKVGHVRALGCWLILELNEAALPGALEDFLCEAKMAGCWVGESFNK